MAIIEIEGVSFASVVVVINEEQKNEGKQRDNGDEGGVLIFDS